LAALALALIVTLTTWASALAHANLVRSDPPAGASLASAPTRVQLWFSEALEPSFSQALIYDTNRARVDQGDSHVAPDDPRSLVVGVKPNLPNGTYVIAWTTQSRVDGHVVRGLVPFGVGVAVAPTDATAAAPVQGAVSGSPVEMALRWLVLLAAAGLVGAFSFWILQANAGPDGDDSAPNPVAPGQTRVAFASVALFLVASVGLLLLQTSIAANVSLVQVFGPPIALVLTQTQYGGIWLTRVALAVVLGLLLAVRGRQIGSFDEGRWDRLGVAIGAALLLTISLTSHSASVNLTTPIGLVPGLLAADWIHLAAFAVWIGGLLQLAVLLPSARKVGAAARARMLGTLVPRFSLVAGIALAAVSVTGLLEALNDVGTLDNLVGKDYGQALLVKIVLVVPLVAIAAVNHYLVRPRLARIRVSSATAAVRDAVDAAGLLRWTVRIEVLFAIAVVAVVGVMTSLSPAQQSAASVSTGPLSLTASAADLQTTFAVSPGRPGPNRYTVDVRTQSGQVDPSVDRVSLRLTYLDSDLGVAEVVLAPSANGRFEGQGSDLAVAGRWQAEVVVRRTGKDDAIAAYGFNVTSNGAQVAQAPQVQVSGLFWVGILVALFGLIAIGRGFVLRADDLRRAGIVAVLGVGLAGVGSYVSYQDLTLAQAYAASQAQEQVHPATAQSVANGALVFRQNCVMCHGLDARGDGPLAPTLNPRPSDLILHVPLHPDTDLEYWIANGFPGSAMPAFGSTLSDQDRWDVLNYLKTQVGAANGTAATIPSNAGTTGAADTSAPTPATSAGAVTPPVSPGSGAGSAVTPTTAAAQATVNQPIASLPAQVNVPTPVVATPLPTQAPPSDGGLSQERKVGDLDVKVQIRPRIFTPAEIDITVRDGSGQPAQNVTGVDLQVAMEGMNHGARGIAAVPTGPGAYRAQAMLLVMQGPWWLALRLQHADGTIDSTLFAFQTPKDTTSGAVSPMYERPTDPVQVEDIAVYPGEISPAQIAVTAKHPVRFEVLFVDHPACGTTVRVASTGAQATVSPDGIADLTFVPAQSGQLQLTCSAAGMVAQ
jgi:copper transport protein